jgi:septal ring factor EnvC (AmiA/AmiB activator)
MSTTTKGAVLRIILPRKESKNLLAQLGPSQRLERREIVLSPGRLATEEIVKYIREFAKLRDETLHTIRLLGISRKARNSVEPLMDPGRKLDEYWKQLDAIRNDYRESQSRIEKLEREIEDAKKRIALINQILETGFGIDDVRSTGLGFNKILGRIPARRLQDAQKALQSNLKDQALIAVGNRKGDWTHLLVAVPSDRAPVALQTLVLHDFVQTEVPSVDQPDLNAALATETQKLDAASKQLEAARRKLQEFLVQASEKLNQLADVAQEALIFLRAVLRLGDNTTAEHAFTVLEKNPPSKVLEALTRSGALIEAE